MTVHEEYQLDTIALNPQPTEHEWEDYLVPQGFDGDGAPFYQKYWVLVLRCPINVNGHEWYQWADGATHSVYAPEPGTPNTFDTYNSVYVHAVTQGVTLKKTGVQGVEMRIGAVEV